MFAGGSRVARTVRLQIDVRPLLQSQTAWRPPLHLHSGTIEVNMKDTLPAKNVFVDAQRCCYVGCNDVFLLPKSSDGVISSFSDHAHK